MERGRFSMAGDPTSGLVATPGSAAAGALVAHYLERLAARDWVALEACLAPGVVRVGPFGDVYRPRAAYLEFLSTLLPTLVEHTIEVTRIVAVDRVAAVELREGMVIDGERVETPEVLVFNLDHEGLIERLDIYIQSAAPASGD